MEEVRNQPATFAEGLKEEADKLNNLSPHGFDINAHLVDLTKRVPDPVVLLYQESTKRPIFTEGSLSLILGASKSRKTTLAVGLCCALLGKPMFGMLSVRKDYKIVFVDTEQGLTFSHRTTRKVHKLMGWDTETNKHDRLRYYDLREFNKEQRRNFILDVVLQDKPDVLFIDGLVDLCDDFNNNIESSKLIDDYLKLSAENKMHICACLHFNKDKKTARGHLGAMYMQKCETSIQVEYHDYYSEVLPAVEGCRHLPFEPFAFQMVGFDGLPELFDASKILETSKPSTAEERAKGIVEKVFASNDFKPIQYNELSRRIVAESGNCMSKNISSRTALNYIRDLTKSGYLVKDNVGGYSLGRFHEDTQTEIEYPEDDEE